MRCKHCKEKFVPKYFNHKFCMDKYECIAAFMVTVRKKMALDNKAKLKAEKLKWNKEKEVIKDRIKSHSELLNDLQDVFNHFIRLRDKDLPCISCGTMNQDIKYDAGHYYSRKGYSGIRFDEDNVHKQCSNRCNLHMSGNFAEYSIQLPRRIGEERFLALKVRRHIELKLSIPEIREKIAYYKLKVKELSK